MADIMLGTKWFCYDKNGNLIVIRVVGRSSIEKVSVKELIGNDKTKVGKRRKIDIKALKDRYTLLEPDAYISFNIVTVENPKPFQDIIISMHKVNKNNEISIDNAPYCVCRQNIINVHSTMIMYSPDEYEIGMCLSQESCPVDVDYKIMTACDKVDKTITIAAYCDDRLADILEPIKGRDLAEFNIILTNLTLEYIKELSDENRKIEMNNYNKTGTTWKGYCNNIKSLLTRTEFMYDFSRAFGIGEVKTISLEEHIVKGDILNGFIVDQDAIKEIVKIYRMDIKNPTFLVYDKDINLDEIPDNKILIRDWSERVFICIYE